MVTLFAVQVSNPSILASDPNLPLVSPGSCFLFGLFVKMAKIPTDSCCFLCGDKFFFFSKQKTG